MFCISRQVLVIISVVVFVSCYDREIKISNLQGCRELLIDHHEIIDSFEISELYHNEARIDEILRMKFYVLGHDMHVRISDSSNFTKMHYAAFIHGSGGGKNYKTAIAQTETRYGSWRVLKEADETAVTDRFYYTLLHLVITKDGWIKFYLKETELLVSTQVWDYFPPTIIAFGKSAFEESSRIFFDCPHENNHNLEFPTSTVNYEEIQEIRSKASSLSGGELLFFLFTHVITYWIYE
ncbi:hypothetical protein ACFFRR_007052 [Megaselia abdita]